MESSSWKEDVEVEKLVVFGVAVDDVVAVVGSMMSELFVVVVVGIGAKNLGIFV